LGRFCHDPFYSAKIEATRRSLPAREVSAAIRALLDEQSAAFRELADRRGAVSKASRERRQGAHIAAREARRATILRLWPPQEAVKGLPAFLMRRREARASAALMQPTIREKTP
jgi:hypothetical protein